MLLEVRLAGKGPLALQELADQIAVTRSNVSAELVRLEAEGLISRSIDPQDRRRIRASVTSRGKVQLGEWLRMGSTAVASLLSPLDGQALERLADLTAVVGKFGKARERDEISVARALEVQRLYPDVDMLKMSAALTLGRASDAVRNHLERALAGTALTLRHYNALILVSYLDGAPLQLAALVAATGGSRPGVGRTLRELEERQLIERSEDAEDRRRIRAVLTSLGQERLQAVLPTVTSGYAEPFLELSAAERSELLTLLKAIDSESS
ncbi:MarR family winged helix-turn-helix transcriptional regulator [Streptomyces sp. OE57]|uniref:MarR family winged helix-turn-helix transcriptional regulator n=1 Tax=Streptomyces lacaronensis TaxID=3379885 RepID=UPI0039B76223